VLTRAGSKTVQITFLSALQTATSPNKLLENGASADGVPFDVFDESLSAGARIVVAVIKASDHASELFRLLGESADAPVVNEAESARSVRLPMIDDAQTAETRPSGQSSEGRHKR